MDEERRSLTARTDSLRCAAAFVGSFREERVDTILHVKQHVQEREMPRLVMMIDHDAGGERMRLADLPGEDPQ